MAPLTRSNALALQWTLPPALQRIIFALLPADAKARAACVCRAWRDAIAEPLLWQSVDLSVDPGGVRCAVTDAVLQAVMALSGGTLHTLNLNGRIDRVSFETVAALAAAGSLRVLQMREPDEFDAEYDGWELEHWEDLLEAAPQLCIRDVELGLVNSEVYGDDILAVLRNERLMPQRLSLEWEGGDDPPEDLAADEAQLLKVAAALASSKNAFLTDLRLASMWLDTAVKFNAIVDAVVSLRGQLTHLDLNYCRLTHTCLPGLDRLLGANSTLKSLRIAHGTTFMDDVTTTHAFADLLQANTSLTELHLQALGFWDAPAVGTAILNALVGH